MTCLEKLFSSFLKYNGFTCKIWDFYNRPLHNEIIDNKLIVLKNILEQDFLFFENPIIF